MITQTRPSQRVPAGAGLAPASARVWRQFSVIIPESPKPYGGVFPAHRRSRALGANMCLILLAIAAREDNGREYHDSGVLAEMTGLSRGVVSSRLALLVEGGWLGHERRGRVNLYWLAI